MFTFFMSFNCRYYDEKYKKSNVKVGIYINSCKMSEQNGLANTSTLADLPVKRKRGRPRKDEGLVKQVNPHTNVNQYVEVNPSDGIDDDMVGQVVSGVIEGSFDAGYFLSVKVCTTGTLLRGVVFQPGLFIPVTAANDIAPLSKMYKRREHSIPIFSPQSQGNGVSPHSEQIIKQPTQPRNQVPSTPDRVLLSALQSSAIPLTNMPKNDSSVSLGGHVMPQRNEEFELENQSTPLLENLKMVEQDDVMQVFEVSSSSGPKDNLEAAKDVIFEKAVEDVLPGKVTIDQEPQVHNLAMESGPQPTQLIQNKLQKSTLVLHQTPAVAKPQCMPLAPQSVGHGLEQTELTSNEPESHKSEPHQTQVVPKVKSEPPGPQFAEMKYKPSELVHNELIYSNLEDHQTHAISKLQFMPLELIGKPLDTMMERQISMKNDIEQHIELEPVTKILTKDETSDADDIEVGSRLAPKEDESIPSKPELASEEYVPLGKINHQSSTSSCPMTDKDVFQDTILPAQLHSHPSNLSEIERG
ncbi:unnamed protein product [Ilex paraguariensis]|uniref:AT hook motif-containing protein n=1 Tax=Ilex paraguariensis TaxID=185542 RepID=A0ABC8V354_9AQUA